MAEKCQGNENRVIQCRFQINAKMHQIMDQRLTVTIDNVSKLTSGNRVTSPDFHLTPFCVATVSFRKDNTDLWLLICNKTDITITFERNIALLDCNGKVLHEEKDKRLYTLGKVGEVDLIGSVADVKRFDTLPNDRLVIDIGISTKDDLTAKMHQFKCDSDARKKLSEDFKTMLENPVNPDIQLHVGDEQISAHWLILCARSPYFKNMFNIQMKERLQNSVTITDISISTLKNLIEFLYTGYFLQNDKSDNVDDLFDLYYAADKYEVMDLRTLCGRKMMSNATPDNVCQILQLAHRHNDKQLKMKAMGFIHARSDEVLQTDGWKKFEATEPLTAEVFTFCFKKHHLSYWVI